MTGYWICPERLFDGQTLHTGAAVRIQNDRVVDVSHAPQEGIRIAGCLSPGFVDLQVNGGGGRLLNTAPTPETLAIMAAAHHQFGTVAILPTVITDAPEVLDKTVDAVLARRGDAGLIGLHIEGPHIARARRGTHEPSFIRPLDARTMDAVAKLRSWDVPVMITLAPEAATPAQISALSALGAIVSLGHTDADAEDVHAALNAGASCGTHLFNAMSPMQGRAPGAVGAILNAGTHFGIICDGYHVDFAMVALALRAARHPERAFVVSDAMATIGGADHFDLYGRAVHLEEGRLINTEGNLAGAHVTQAEAVANLVRHVGVSLERALHMAITTPATFIGAPDLATLDHRTAADLVVICDDLTVTGVPDAPVPGSALNAAQ